MTDRLFDEVPARGQTLSTEPLSVEGYLGLHYEMFHVEFCLASCSRVLLCPVYHFDAIAWRREGWSIIIEPRHEKTCLRGFGPGKTQTGLLS